MTTRLEVPTLRHFYTSTLHLLLPVSLHPYDRITMGWYWDPFGSFFFLCHTFSLPLPDNQRDHSK